MHGQPPPRAIAATRADGALLFAASRPGRVVAIIDPLGGGTLLIGTQLEGGQATEAARQAPEFAVLRTSQGIAVEPLSDRLELQAIKEGQAQVGSVCPAPASRWCWRRDRWRNACSPTPTG